MSSNKDFCLSAQDTPISFFWVLCSLRKLEEDDDDDDDNYDEEMGDERYGEKLLSRQDVTEMPEQRLQNYRAYLNIAETRRGKFIDDGAGSSPTTATQPQLFTRRMVPAGRNYRDLINPSALEAV